jgi:carbonic anhydrase/acetyltransferase-like protein (isoleucine patch superfamily)
MVAAVVAAACVVGVTGALVARVAAVGMGGLVGSGALVCPSATVAAGAAVPLGNVVVLGEPQAASNNAVAITATVDVFKLGIRLLSPLSLWFLLGWADTRQGSCAWSLVL